MGGFNTVGGALGEDQAQPAIVSFYSLHSLRYLVLITLRLFFLFKLLASDLLYPTNCRESLRDSISFVSNKFKSLSIRSDPFGLVPALGGPKGNKRCVQILTNSL